MRGATSVMPDWPCRFLPLTINLAAFGTQGFAYQS